MNKPNLIGMPMQRLTEWIVAQGEKPFRARQIFSGIHRSRWFSWDRFTTLAKDSRARLSELALLDRCEVVDARKSADGDAEKLLLRCGDGEHIECVLLRDGKRITVCLSSQVGCALGCAFCATGLDGLKRNLSAAEIVDQFHALGERLREGERITNVVLMGMGEPLMNVDAVLDAVDVLTCDLGVGLASRRITVSTVGVVPGIEALSRHDGSMGLAVSVGSPFEGQRRKLIPISKRYPLRQVLAAAVRYAAVKRRRLTLEYVLLKNVNDSPDHAAALATLARNSGARINLIRFNPVGAIKYKGVKNGELDAFARMLLPTAPAVTVRKSLGADVSAACGQLRNRLTDVHPVE
jgi:23S rRNA (adenine2503-C2)-methyltransferase